MTITPQTSDAPPAFPSGANPPFSGVEESVAQLDALVGHFDAAPAAPPGPAVYDNRLVEVRLGIGSSLFTALRHKHPATAAHSLRVALGCSSWAFALGLESEVRDELEVAALMHDIGKIGVPDRLLLKPGVLAAEEARLMDQYRLSGLDILASCCPSQSIVDIIRNSAGWYDGSRPNYPREGDQIPAGARMLAVIDAFDSMTSDQAYRQAMSRDRALGELFKHAGRQFDPDLVRSFSDLEITAPLRSKVISHWLQTLEPQRSNRFWRSIVPVAADASAMRPAAEAVFQQKLLDNMHDAVIFVDREKRIIQWNRGAERLTGISPASVLEHNWSPSLINMHDPEADVPGAVDCPITYCMTTGVQSLRRLLVAGRDDRPVAVDAHTVPVIGPDGTMYGAAMLLHDVSGEATLEERCQNLHERATKDPLTQVANRAEFDRAYGLFLQAHLERRVPCSLIMCDVDHFKLINDTYGHQAGDEVLRFFGDLLKSECRSGDLVARYGGEEFVLLCADCNNAAAARRAEQLRLMVNELPQPAINGSTVTVSFGVTEIQPGDTAESMLRRADRALFEAKRMGRNMVVQLGAGFGDPRDAAPETRRSARPANSELVLERVLVTAVPLSIAVEKLRGFVLDHHVEILSIEADRIDLQIHTHSDRRGRRRSDRGVPFLVELSFAEQQVGVAGVDGRAVRQVSRTRVLAAIRLKRPGDRRSSNIIEQATAILAGIQSYLMATDETDSDDTSGTRRAVNLLARWMQPRH